jgi:plasmid stabilization system protein ParE
LAAVVITPTAVADLDRLTKTLNLPGTTRARVRTSLELLASFPLLGPQLTGRWEGFRFILGPWSWMLIVYVYEQEKDEVAVVTIQDARSSQAATSQR